MEQLQEAIQLVAHQIILRYQAVAAVVLVVVAPAETTELLAQMAVTVVDLYH